MRIKNKNNNLQAYLCFESASVTDAMVQIDKNSVGLVYITDVDYHLVGCLTDGDIRRFLIRKGNLKATVKEVMNREPKYVKQVEIGTAKEMMEKELVYSVAVVDNEMIIKDVIFLESFLLIKTADNRKEKSLAGTPVIIMAGGKGTRLYPYTRILPKPLIPIGDVPILERIFNRLASYGVEDFYLTVNYKKEMIKSYFAEVGHPYRIHYIDEEKPMGTAGSISLIHRYFDKPVIVTNCDILIETDYGKMMKHHLDSGNDITIIASLKKTIIPYGVLYSKTQGRITSIEEKPQITHIVNTGMYVINPEFLKWIPEDRVFHMTDLVKRMIQEDRQVGMYPISENAFLDMGEFEEMKRMEEHLLQGQDSFGGNAI